MFPSSLVQEHCRKAEKSRFLEGSLRFSLFPYMIRIRFTEWYLKNEVRSIRALFLSTYSSVTVVFSVVSYASLEQNELCGDMTCKV